MVVDERMRDERVWTRVREGRCVVVPVVCRLSRATEPVTLCR